MQFTTITGRDQPEAAWGSYINKTGAASVVGRVVMHDIVTARDGKSVIQPTAAGLSSVVGPMLQAGIADGEPVLVGTLGLHNTLVKGKVGSGGATVAGNILIPVTGEYNLLYSAAATGLSGFATLCDSDVAQDAAAALKKVLWRL